VSEIARNIRSASRQCLAAVKGHTEADIEWVQARILEFMKTGLAFVDAVDAACWEATDRILAREKERKTQERLRYREELRRKAEEAGHVDRHAPQGKPKPTLRTSLGDLAAARRRA
jgi:hypothetical protein